MVVRWGWVRSWDGGRGLKMTKVPRCPSTKKTRGRGPNDLGLLGVAKTATLTLGGDECDRYLCGSFERVARRR